MSELTWQQLWFSRYRLSTNVVAGGDHKCGRPQMWTNIVHKCGRPQTWTNIVHICGRPRMGTLFVHKCGRLQTWTMRSVDCTLQNYEIITFSLNKCEDYVRGFDKGIKWCYRWFWQSKFLSWEIINGAVLIWCNIALISIWSWVYRWLLFLFHLQLFSKLWS